MDLVAVLPASMAGLICGKMLLTRERMLAPGGDSETSRRPLGAGRELWQAAQAQPLLILRGDASAALLCSPACRMSPLAFAGAIRATT